MLDGGKSGTLLRGLGGEPPTRGWGSFTELPANVGCGEQRLGWCIVMCGAIWGGIGLVEDVDVEKVIHFSIPKESDSSCFVLGPCSKASPIAGLVQILSHWVI